MTINFDNISKKFGSNIIAVSDINLGINGGEFIFLVGPSGAGKSTILRLLSREYLPNEGKITIDGTDITKIKPRYLPLYRRKVGVVFQDFKLLEDRTVFENVALSLEVRGVLEEETQK